MAKLNIENLPDDLIQQLQILARLEQRQKLSVQGLDSTMLLREDRDR